MPNIEQLRYQTEKKQPPEVFYKNAALKIFAIFLKILQYSRENAFVKILRTPVLNNICIQLLLNWLYEVLFGTLFLDCIQNHLDSAILQIYQRVSNQSFTKNLVHMPSIYLTHTFSCEPWFHMLVMNSY